MPAFPYYDTKSIQALNAQAVALLDLFAARGYAREEPAVLQPAEIFLNRSGEEIRRRTFTLTDPSGRDLALRPDLTIPNCREAVRSGRSLPARLAYNAIHCKSLRYPLPEHRNQSDAGQEQAGRFQI